MMKFADFTSLQSMAESPPRRIAYVGVIALLVFAGWLRWGRIRDSLWVDELHTSWSISEDFRDVAPRARQGNQIPVYFWGQWLVQHAFGSSELILRSTSFVAGELLIAVLAWFVFKITSSVSATCVAAALMAIDGNLIFFANDARPYAGVMLFATISVIACYHYSQMTGESTATHMWRIIWTVFTTLAVYLHVTAILLLTGELAYLAFVAMGCAIVRRQPSATPTRTRQLSIRAVLLDAFIFAVLLTPVIPIVRPVIDRRENWTQFIGRRDLHHFLSVFPSLRVVGTAALAGLIACIWDVRRNRWSQLQTHWKRIRPATILALFWFFVPAIVAFAVNNTDIARIFFRRYLVAILPATYLMIGLAVALPKSKIGRHIVAMTVLLFGMAVSPIVSLYPLSFHVPPHTRENWRAAIDYLNHVPKKQFLILRSGLIEDDYLLDPHRRSKWTAYSQLPVNGLYRLKRADCQVLSLPYSPVVDLPEIRDAMVSANEVWLLLRGREKSRESILQQLVGLSRLQMTVAEKRNFGSALAVYRLTRHSSQ